MIGAIVTVFLVGGGVMAVFVALAPTVPQVKPHAQEPATTPACSLTFTVTVPKFTCDKIALAPDNQTITSGAESRLLTVFTSSSSGSLTYAWTKTSPGGDAGTYSATNLKSVVWTAPANLSADQNWTFNVVVTDSTGANVTCQTGVSYKTTVLKICNDTCLKTEECGSGLICAGGNCRNSACITQPTCVCPPPTPPVPPTPPTPTCNSPCTTSADCPSNLGCTSGKCRNVSCADMVGCVCQAPAPLTHKVCQGRSCVTVSGAGTDTCTSDVICAPVAAPPPIPKSGVELPTVLTILGGVTLLVIGLIAL